MVSQITWYPTTKVYIPGNSANADAAKIRSFHTVLGYDIYLLDEDYFPCKRCLEAVKKWSKIMFPRMHNVVNHDAIKFFLKAAKGTIFDYVFVMPKYGDKFFAGQRNAKGARVF